MVKVENMLDTLKVFGFSQPKLVREELLEEVDSKLTLEDYTASERKGNGHVCSKVGHDHCG